ncbi:KPN_02809 family neutral zinc metallopeptidase [Aquamicrobium zhengzhouense]|uniref:Zinc metallopeptidase n=1 Tax=Aquamicrobium zhengzhouense TaxID=2781738 RepID=A0ABS0S9K7_9HYPH|nr:neutral zinc metallopeptidase [Aquamicrobium zhengzhouense]MBI1619985.1 zinc metallopeptidase [Aquamicrobium zhengzhouense]
MLWKGRRQSSNIEDRRGRSGMPGGRLGGGGPIRLPIGRGAGGGGLSGIIILVVIFFALRACGIDPMQILEGGSGAGSQQISFDRSEGSSQVSDEEAQFVSVVLAETEDVWNGIFQSQGQNYTEPRLVLFTNQIQSACGYASSASGPFYCPGDSRVYIDLGFFRELAQRFAASGDFAQAYVIAHEVGHHVQNLIGVLPEFNRQRQRMSQLEANQMSTRVELQADCFAGIWAHFTAQKGLLEDGDIEEALNAAHQIGDDTLQKRTQGYVVPESFNHGTSEQRMTWFANGLRNGRLEDCDTFNNPV